MATLTAAAAAPAHGNAWTRTAALGLMTASGFAALGYQIVWTEQCTMWLGHDSAAVLAVVAAFFGGVALGSLVLGPHIELSRRPERWYAGCEAAIALWCLVLAVGMAPIDAALLKLTGTQPSVVWHWAVAFLGCFLMLLPATAAMGATLPAMQTMLTRRHREGQHIAALYAANTFGAVAGVLGAAFWLVPHVGLTRTAGLCAALNLVCASAALLAFGNEAAPAGRTPRAASDPPERSDPASTVVDRRLLPTLVATGLLGIGYEVLVVRVLSQVAENTVYTFAMLLALYLIGTAIGAAAYPRAASRFRESDGLQDRLLWSLAAACLVGGGTLWQAEAVKAWMLDGLGPGMPAALASEAALAALGFLAPTVAMGALFSHLATRARTTGLSFHRVLGFNTLGAAAAPWLFGVALIPAVGAKFALLALVVGYLALLSRAAWKSPVAWSCAACALGAAVLAPPLVFVDVPEGGHVVSYREGSAAAVSVVEDAEGVSRLRIDNREQEGSSSSLVADARQALLPVLLHPAPRRALFLGLGTGVTSASAAEDPALQVDAVELLPEVIAASAHFTDEFSLGTPPRLHLIASDARRFVRTSDQRYDVIVADNFHPARSGSGALYTVEHFAAVRERLAPGGIFCQWLPLHQLDLDTLRSIVRSYLVAFPGGSAMLATHSLETPVLGLVSSRDGAPFDVSRIRDRLAASGFPRPLAGFGLVDDLSLLGSLVAGPRSLARFAAEAPLNTDDRPVVTYSAPRITYAPDSLPRDRLIALLHELSVEPGEVVSHAPEPDWSGRLANYWRARDRFIEVGRDVRPTPDARAMLAQVREPLLSVLRISPDFRPARAPLVMMAAALARSDAVESRKLTEVLAALPAKTP